MADAATMAGWRPDALFPVSAGLSAGADEVERGNAAVGRQVGGGLFSGGDSWRGDAADAGAATLAALLGHLGVLADGILDMAAVTSAAADRLLGPVAQLVGALATQEQAASVLRGGLSLANAEAYVMARRRAEAAAAAVEGADSGAANGFGPTTQDAHVLLRQVDPAAVRAILAVAGAGDGLPVAGTPALLVADWWATRTDMERSSLLAAHPRELGSLDGLPARDRDTANRLALLGFIASYATDRSALVARCERSLSATDFGGAGAALADLATLDRRKAFYDSVAATVADYGARAATDGPAAVVLLLIAEPDAFGDHGRAAVSFGDLDSAAHVAFVVPGLRQRVVPELQRTAGNAWRARGAADSRDASNDVAVVAWVGYDVPMSLDVAGESDARAGARLLAADLSAVRAARGDAALHLTVVGHSYGSTTVGVMLRDHPDVPVDDAVLVGSPGVGVDHVSQLHIDPAHVWVGAASGDAVDHLAHFGADPASPSFGAQVFNAETSHTSWWNPFEGHSHYFDAGEPSLAAIGSVIRGEAPPADGPRVSMDPPYVHLGIPAPVTPQVAAMR